MKNKSRKCFKWNEDSSSCSGCDFLHQCLVCDSSAHGVGHHRSKEKGNWLFSRVDSASPEISSDVDIGFSNRCVINTSKSEHEPNQNICSSFNSSPLTRHYATELGDDPDRDFILDGIEHGFKLVEDISLVKPAVCKNYPSSTNANVKHIVDIQLREEIRLGRIAEVLK